MAYSNNGAYLAVLVEKKVATVFIVADGYTVNILRYIYDFIYFLFFNNNII